MLTATFSPEWFLIMFHEILVMFPEIYQVTLLSLRIAVIGIYLLAIYNYGQTAKSDIIM